jgi:hypothetical protein
MRSGESRRRKGTGGEAEVHGGERWSGGDVGGRRSEQESQKVGRRGE